MVATKLSLPAQCRSGPIAVRLNRGRLARRSGSRTGRRYGTPRQCCGRRLPGRAPSARAGCSRRSSGSWRSAAASGPRAARACRTAAGEKRRLKPVMSSGPSLRLGVERLDRCELVRGEASGFSTKTCLPASSARSASAACRVVPGRDQDEVDRRRPRAPRRGRWSRSRRRFVPQRLARCTRCGSSPRAAGSARELDRFGRCLPWRSCRRRRARHGSAGLAARASASASSAPAPPRARVARAARAAALDLARRERLVGCVGSSTGYGLLSSALERHAAVGKQAQVRLHVAVLGPADVGERIVVALLLVDGVVAARAVRARDQEVEFLLVDVGALAGSGRRRRRVRRGPSCGRPALPG